MLLYLSLFGIFLSLLLLYFNASKYPSSIYLGVNFLLVSLYGVNQYVIMWSESVFWVAIFNTNFAFLYYLIGPMSYFYIRSVINDNARLRKSDFFHFIPMMVYLAAAMPHMLSSYAYKVHVAKLTISEPGFLGSYRFTILTDWFTSAAVYISRPTMVFLYALFSTVLISRLLLSKNKPNALSEDRFIKKWMFTFVSFQLLLVMSHILFLTNSFGLFGKFSSTQNDFFTLLSSVALIGLIILPILFPRILYGLHILTTPVYKPAVDVASEIKEVIRKIPVCDEDYMSFIQSKVDVAMKEHLVYLQKEYNLQQLSVLIQVPTHHLANYFSNYKKQTFNDYRNEFRVRHAKALMLQKQSGLMTIEAIGHLSGFSNRNTFTKAFKEIEGVTPGAFLAQIKR